MSKKRVLIVDDDEALRQILRLTMEREDFEVEEAEDGSAGLDKTDEFSPDIIVLDLMMPRTNGIDMLHKLQEKSSKVPIVIMTGYSQQVDEATLRKEANVVEFLKKPVRFGDLVALLSRFVESK